MWFHKTGRFAVGDNGEPSASIYTACALLFTVEHLKLINCQQYPRHKKTSKAAVFMSTQCKAINNLRANAVHRHCCLSGPVSKSCTAVVTPSSDTAASAQLSHWLHQVTRQIVCSIDVEFWPVQDTY